MCSLLRELVNGLILDPLKLVFGPLFDKEEEAGDL